MKRWQTIFSAAMMGATILTTSLMIQPAHSQEATGGRKVIYLFSTEFPSRDLNPVAPQLNPAAQETRFWQLLDKEMKTTSDLSLTENMEDADYRVELRCGGIANCSKLVVDIKDMQRDVLASFTVKNVVPLWGLIGGNPRLDQVAHDLTQTLDQRLKLLEQGGYGHTD